MRATNSPPEEFVSISEERLLEFSTACFENVGLDAEHASAISRLLVNSDLRGVRSHGTMQVNGYCRLFADGQLNRQPEIEVVHETPTSVVVSGDGTLGYWPMMQATELAIAKAKEVGIGMGLARHIGHYGSAGHYARRCMENGCIAYSSQGWHGQGDCRGQDPKPKLGYFGNPPMCFAIPSDKEPPVVLDMGTYILTGIPGGPAIEKLFGEIPVAFYRSVGMGVISSLLGGGLAGITLPESNAIAKKWPAAHLGGMVVAIHAGSVVHESVFLAEADRIVRDIRESYEPLPNHDEALVPGAVEERRMELHRKEGVRYGPMEQKQTKEVCERMGVGLPWCGSG